MDYFLSIAYLATDAYSNQVTVDVELSAGTLQVDGKTLHKNVIPSTGTKHLAKRPIGLL